MSTNKELLAKGIKELSITALLFFVAPFILNQAFKNQDHSFFIPVLILGFIAAAAAILMGFKGIRTIIKGIFND